MRAASNQSPLRGLRLGAADRRPAIASDEG
jgi:hypothetical protein